MSQISQELDYKRETYIHPTYKLSRILPLSGTQTYVLNNTGGTDVYFELPINAYNLSESFFEFDMTSALVNNYNITYKDVFHPIRLIELYTRAGVYLCRLDHLPNYTKVVWKVDTPLQEYLAFDKFQHNSGAGNFLRTNRIIGSPCCL